MSETAARRDYGTGSVYQRSGRKRWTVAWRYVDPVTGLARRRTETVDTEDEGKDLLAGWQGLTDAQHAAQGEGPLTVRELAGRWLDEKDPLLDRSDSPAEVFTERRVQEHVWEKYESEIRVHILPTLGAVRLDALDGATVRRFLSSVDQAKSEKTGQRLSHSMREKTYRRLRQLMDFGVARDWVARHPMIGIKGPQDTPGTDDGAPADQSPVERALKVAEMRRCQSWLRREYGADHPAYVLRWQLGFELGLRQSEVLGLTWDTVDLDSRELTIRQQLRHRPHRHGCEGTWPDEKTSPCTVAARAAAGDSTLRRLTAYHCPQRVDAQWNIVATTKSKRVRHVRFSEEIAKGLTDLHDAQHPVGARPLAAAERRRLSASRRQATYPVTDADLVIRTPAGRYQSHDADHHQWDRMLAGAHVDGVGHDVHSARHTAATNLVRAEVPLTTVQKMLGHSTIAVTQRYVTTDQESQGVALDRLGAFLATYEA